MYRALVAAVCAGAMAAVATCPGRGQEPPTDAHVINVEIRGRLAVPSKAAADSPKPPTITASGLTVELEFVGRPPAQESLRKLDQRTVIVRGTLKGRGPGRLICVVEGSVEDAGQGGRQIQYLVGYQDEQAAKVESLCRTLGLKVIDHYRPGKYLVVEPTEKADAKSLETLKSDRAVRYVEKNTEYRVPEK